MVLLLLLASVINMVWLTRANAGMQARSTASIGVLQPTTLLCCMYSLHMKPDTASNTHTVQPYAITQAGVSPIAPVRLCVNEAHNVVADGSLQLIANLVALIDQRHNLRTNSHNSRDVNVNSARALSLLMVLELRADVGRRRACTAATAARQLTLRGVVCQCASSSTPQTSAAASWCCPHVI
jgi:hypothetical protein